MNDLIELFLNDRSVYCRRASVEYYSENLERFNRFLDQEDLSVLDPDAFRKYVLFLRQKGVSAVTVQTYSRAVKVFYSFLLDSGRIMSDFTAGVRLPRSDNKLIVPIFKDDAAIIDDYLDTTEFRFRNLLVFHLMLDCGLRSGEVVALKPDSFDIPHRCLKIQYSKSRYGRIIPLPLDVIKLFNVSRDDLPSLTPGAVKMLFQRIKHHTGIDRVHAHLLRHTFATSFIAQGGNLELLRLYLGHADYNITRQYIHLASMYSYNKSQLYPIDDVFFHPFS